MEMVRIRQDGAHVQVVKMDGTVLLDLPWDAAIQVANGMIHHAKEIESIVKHESIARDQAILIKGGYRIGLTNNKHIQAEAMDAALYDRDLNRYMGPGIKSQEQFGTPTIKQTPDSDNGPVT